MGCRRQPLCRLLWRPWRADARPPASRGDAGGERGVRRRHAFRRQPSARGAVGTCHPAAGAVGGAGALHLLRHRGHADGGAARARVHRARDAAAFPGTFPWLARPYGQRLHEPLRRLADAGRSAGRSGQGGAAAAQRHRRRARCPGGQPRHRGGDPGADRRLVRPAADRRGIRAGAAAADGTARRAAHPR